MPKYKEMFVLRLVGGREKNWYDWPWDCLEETYWDSPQYLFMSIYDNYCSFGNLNYVERVLIPKPAVINENKEGGICLQGYFFPSTYLELCLVPIRATSHSDNGPLWELTLSFYGYFMLNHVQWSFAPSPFLWCPDKTLTTFQRMLCLLICLSLSLSSIVILRCVRPWSAELNLTSSSLPDQLLLLEEASRGSGLR